MLTFMELSVAERNHILAEALPRAQAHIKDTIGTALMIEWMVRELPPEQVPGKDGRAVRQRISNWLVKRGASGDVSGVRASAATFRKFGRDCHRYIWFKPPVPVEDWNVPAAEVAYAPARISASDAVDSWMVPAAEGEMGRLKRELAEAKEVIAKKDAINRILLDKLSGTENAGHAEDD